jgi:hypothetical protein
MISHPVMLFQPDGFESQWFTEQHFLEEFRIVRAALDRNESEF